MRDEEGQTVPSSSSINGAANMSVKKDGCGFEGVFGRGKYKLWALGAITLLAVWSMFTGTVTLKWSDVNLKHASNDLDPSLHSDLDVLVLISHHSFSFGLSYLLSFLLSKLEI